MSSTPFAVCIMGPTASGKSDCSLAVAERRDCEIISVDSAMIYRGMDIGTAKPSIAERARCPHHLIDILDPSETYSAAQFQTAATKLIHDIHARGNCPVLVGGTMLYFHALQHGLSPLPKADPDIRQQLEQQLKTEGLSQLHNTLADVDPESAQRIHQNDPQRILRALEVYLATGIPLTQHWQQASPNSGVTFLNFALCPFDRARLHDAIERRFLAMLDAGMLDEARALLQRPDLHRDLPALRTVGYRQALAYLAGEMDYQTMQTKAIVATRQLAKRQMTWLRQWELVELAADKSAAVEPIVAAIDLHKKGTS